jgi:Zn-dependent membrane protease YugP
MSIPIRAGVVLGVLCVVWTFVMGFTGWYKDPVMLNLFFLVIPLEIGLVIWALRKTAPGATWGGQVVNGLKLAAVASVIIFAGSLLFTTVAFPAYFNDLRTAHAEMLKSAGLPEAEIQSQVAAAAAMQTPFINAISGVIGTVVTGVVVAAIAGAFWRKK